MFMSINNLRHAVMMAALAGSMISSALAQEGSGNVQEQAWNAAARIAAMTRQTGVPNQAGPGQSFGPGMNPQMMGQGNGMRPQGNQFASANFNPSFQAGNPDMAGRMGGMPNGGMPKNGMALGFGNGMDSGTPNGMPNASGNPNAGRGRMNSNPSNQGLPNQGTPNQMRRQMAGGDPGAEGRQGPQGPMGNGPMNYRGARPVEQGQVDLVLEDIALAGDATLVAGPAYAVRFRNQGLQAAGKFSVLLGASLDGHLAQDAPKTVVEVPALEPGKGLELTLRLPMTALRMGEGKVQFSHLIVMIDATNTIEESDKSNNGAVLERGELEAPVANGESKPAAE